MQSIGICVGASTITRVDLAREKDKIIILNTFSKTHEGNIRKTLESLLPDSVLKEWERIAITGRKFKNLISLSTISEPEAIELAYTFLKEKYGHTDYISSVGGETFTTYEIDQSNKIINLFTGNKCASGTGEFFLQQIKRMGIDLKEADSIDEIDEAYTVSGRCSVFCKSDCTHALNKGQNKASIIVGLCEMMGKRVLEHLGDNLDKKVWLIGGCSKNTVMVKCLAKSIKNLVIPQEAVYFEALGCALWALDNQTVKAQSLKEVFREEKKSFATLPALDLAIKDVQFKEIITSQAKETDRCILGLDVGSTTTKAILLREKDNAILASIYGKTLGDPIKAAKNCYQALKEQISGVEVEIIGLGVTGSGRQIAGLHALTDSVYNEISAHAAAAVHFDREVDTIFEIGGQDAKYTHIINGVPSDYAMNEACSAGTGSFLEESAQEYLNIDVKSIQKIAMEAKTPPDFNDQCAAFIGSDIKTALQENVDVKDVVAGLVYSICKNYLNRVKGNRYVGKKIFMQGGVCYNKAVPVAMASLLKRKIIVPPEPGLMGSYGVALMVKEKIQTGKTPEQDFNLDQLIQREVEYGKPFICAGGNIKCDRKCQISIINIEGKKYPFGGICGKYSSIRASEKETLDNNLVKIREEMVYGEFSYQLNPNNEEGKIIAINRSLLVNTLFPLYYNFFTCLGFQVWLPPRQKNKETSVVKTDSSFCYPVNLAHQYFAEIAKSKAHYIFLPHVKGMFVENNIPISLTCPFVQGESYYLRSSFNIPQEVIAPVLDFADGYDQLVAQFVEIGRKLAIDANQAKEAYLRAVDIQKQFLAKCKEIGREFLEEIARTKEKAMVVFGRPYNALVKDGNMGIPEKFASRGYKIIPFDFLPLEEEEPQNKMYWSMGQMIIKAAKFVSKHPQLFGVYVTNFSCGPDSFVVTYFRGIMAQKPSLTLELDSHTADAGIDTRIDAFIDVMKNYQDADHNKKNRDIQLAQFDYRKKKVKLVTGETVSLTDQRVKVIIPSMGHLGSQFMAATFRKIGIDALALPPATEVELQLGRANSTCKECLPLILTVGSLLSYLEKYQDENKIWVYFMPEAPDPCRFGQYHVYTEKLLREMGITNIALLTLSSGNSYGGMSAAYKLRAWKSVVISDVFQEIYSAVLALAKDKEKALAIYQSCIDKIIASIERDSWFGLKNTLEEVAKALGKIELKGSIEKAKKVNVVGEIYVRWDEFSKQNLVEKLADKGIITKIASIAEWVYYCDYLVKNHLSESANLKDKIVLTLESVVRMEFERTIKKILAKSHLYHYHPVDIDQVINNAKDLISPHLSGEAILTVGTAITEVIDHVDGVISIGPFGCMPSRIAEAILTKELSRHKERISIHQLVKEVLQVYPNLPFLSIETDGSAFPQLIDVKLEAFALQVKRVNQLINSLKEKN